MKLVLCAWLGVAAVMMVFWMLQRRSGSANLVDVAWAGLTGSLGLLYALMLDGDPWRRGLLAVMAGAWGWRLAWHILQRARRHPEEDGRYRYLRAHWEQHTQFKFFAFYQAQGLAVMLFSLPFLVIASAQAAAPPSALLAAVGLWAFSLAGETLADRQLAAWRADPAKRGKTCRMGLWRYSRHPNYFFEWLHWWSYVFLAWGSPYGWVALIAQALMLLSLFQVTGIPHTERQALASRGEDYQSYQASTNRFFPWFPKHVADRH